MSRRDRDEKNNSSGSGNSGFSSGNTQSSGSRPTSSGMMRDVYSAPDPIRVAATSSDRGWSRSGTAESLSPTSGGESSGLQRAVAGSPADPDRGVPAAPVKHKRSPSALSFGSVNTANTPPKKVNTVHDARPKTPDVVAKRSERSTTDGKNTSKPEPAKSPQKVREPQMCKARPTDNKPKGGGGGSKSFVPWKGTKFGCK